MGLVPVAARYNARVYPSSLAGIAGSNLSVVSVACCQVEVSAWG